MLTRRAFLRTLGACSSLAAGGGYYTWQVEPGWLELVRRRLPIHRLPPALNGRRLVHLSDLHIGPLVSDDYVRDTFRRVRALRPDIVVVTGDLITWHEDALNQVAHLFQDIPLGRLATVAILGNHDYGPKWARLEIAERLVDTVHASGVTVLRNQILDVEGLQIVGLDDLWAKQFDAAAALEHVDGQRAMLALTHNPDTVDLPGWERFEGWILAGHTHGGQCKPPFLPPPILPVQNRRYTAGAFRLAGNRQLYINRGVGNVMPVRFNARPEVTVFELRS